MDGVGNVVVRGTFKKWLLPRQAMTVADIKKKRKCV